MREAVTDQVPEPARRAPYQPALFPTRDLGRVVPIEAYKQRAAERRERAQEAESSVVTRQSAAGAAAAMQTDFPFTSTAAHAAGPSGRMAASARLSEARFSEAPVANPVHRIMAAGIDFSMVMVAAGVTCLIAAFGAREQFLPGSPQQWFAGLALLLACVYKLFWAALDTDSPGLRWCQLRLLHFDGRDPARRERMARVAWSLLSIMAGGLGLIWCLVDEESLTWHDHSSKTFLTPFSRTPPARK